MQKIKLVSVVTHSLILTFLATGILAGCSEGTPSNNPASENTASENTASENTALESANSEVENLTSTQENLSSTTSKDENKKTVENATSNISDKQEREWWSPGEERTFSELISYPNQTGIMTTYNQSEVTNTKDHPFFSAIGSNGRACVTCHQPADGMSLSATTAANRWEATNGKDPLFAAIDGSNCPHLPQEKKSSHSLLLDHGLFRIFRPWPPLPVNGVDVEPQFTIEVVRDPTDCNTHSEFGLNSKEPTISVYRRPRPTTNLKFITSVGFPFEPKNGLPLPTDPLTGKMVSGNITADSRVWTLREQAIDALRSHLEYEGDVNEETIEKILQFEQQLTTAQSFDFEGGSLTDAGANGGPEFLAQAEEGVLNSGTRLPMWNEFDAWLQYLDDDFDAASSSLSNEQLNFRRSVARGVIFFRDKTFLVKDNAGITDMGFGNPVRNDCNFCHNMTRVGMDVAPGQVDLGTVNLPFADPAPHLPLFKLTCKEGFPPHAHLGKVVFTNDPGFALTTGRCKDIGKITIQGMRGLAARAPYFSNGSAKTIREIVDYYVRRYNMDITEQDKQDLTNLMRVL